LKTDPNIPSFFTSLSSTPLAILAGFIFTVIVQSSSVTSGILVLLADSNLLTLGQLIPILLGSAIGTTVTALFISLKMSLHAKRTAAAHFIFNMLGVLVILPFLGPFENMVAGIGETSAQQAANAYTIFKLSFAIIFLTALKPLKNLIEKAVPGDEEEILFQTRYLDTPLPKKSEDVFRIIGLELGYELEVTEKMFAESKLMFVDGQNARQKILKYESLNDYLDEQIESSLLEFSKNDLSEDEAKKIMLLVRISNTLENLADSDENLIDTWKNMLDSGSRLSPEELDEFIQVYTSFQNNLNALSDGFPSMTQAKKEKMKDNDTALREEINSKYRQHMKRIQTQHGNTMFIELLSILEDSNAKIRRIRKLSETYVKTK